MKHTFFVRCLMLLVSSFIFTSCKDASPSMEALIGNLKSQASPLSIRIEQSPAQSDPTANANINFEIYFGTAVDPATLTAPAIAFDPTLLAVGCNPTVTLTMVSSTHYTSSATAARYGTLRPSIAGGVVKTLNGEFFSASTSVDNSVT